MEEFVMALQKDLVEGSSTDVVMILEKPEAGGIEYLVDGLISIQREELDERRVRHLRLEKLRATNIGRARYAVTLTGVGSRRSASPTATAAVAPDAGRGSRSPTRSGSTRRASPTSTRSSAEGSAVAASTRSRSTCNVGIDDYYMLFTPTFLNFLSQGRGIIAVLAAGESPDKLRETLVRHVPANQFDTRVRIPDYAANETEEPVHPPDGPLRPGRGVARRW